tara:strand:- start:103 stop:756 length:654 start_codon:yes stop_codon:yes gene_type:complete
MTRSFRKKLNDKFFDALWRDGDNSKVHKHNGSLPSKRKDEYDRSRSIGRTGTLPTHNDSITSPEIQEIDAHLSELKKNLKKQKSDETWTNFNEGLSGNFMPSTSQNVIGIKTLIAQTESEIRNLEMKKNQLVRAVTAEKSIPQPSTSRGAMPMHSTASVVSPKGSLPKGITPPKIEKKDQITTSSINESESFQILKMRFAKGEITKDEFLEMKKLLE